jgi:CBS domain-containing protein
LKIGTYDNIATASISTPVIQVINMFVEQNISAVPIVDENGVVLNVYETIDVMVNSVAYYYILLILEYIRVLLNLVDIKNWIFQLAKRWKRDLKIILVSIHVH